MQENKPRNPWIALGMSFALPGFGQLYNGELNKSIWLFLIFAFLSVPGVALVALYLPDGWMLPALGLSLAATLALWVFGMFDAWREAKKRQDYQPERWQISGIYLLVFILCDFLALPFLVGYVHDHQVASYRIPSTSMEPTIQRGDILFADKRYNCPGCKLAIRRGDIAIFTYPNNRTLLYIKRIIALPGDRVQIHGQDITVNDKPLLQTNVVGADTIEAEDGRSWHILKGMQGQATQDEKLVVPPGQVFVLGDNRSASTDSRKFGTVPMQDVVGKARQVWFSKGHNGVRWNRLGLTLE